MLYLGREQAPIVVRPGVDTWDTTPLYYSGAPGPSWIHETRLLYTIVVRPAHQTDRPHDLSIGAVTLTVTLTLTHQGDRACSLYIGPVARARTSEGILEARAGAISGASSWAGAGYVSSHGQAHIGVGFRQ